MTQEEIDAMQVGESRTELSPTGIPIEYIKNEKGGVNVIAHLPMIGSDATFSGEEKEKG